MNIVDVQLNYMNFDLPFYREISCFILPEIGIISSTTNDSSGSVEFDWFDIKDAIWGLKEKNRCPEMVYMLHTHPKGFNRMSSIDRNMVYGWCMALAIPITFIVITEDEIVTYIYKLNKETKKVKQTHIDTCDATHYCNELQIVAALIYGMSKTKNLSKENLVNIIEAMQNSKVFETFDQSFYNMFNYKYEILDAEHS